MDSLVMQGYKGGLKIVPTIPRYDNSGTEITDANYWPVPIDSVFRTNYGFNVYTGNGELVTTTDTTKRFIITDYGGFTPKNPQESYSAQELYNLVLDARGLTHGKNYALSILDSTTGKSGRVILTASDNTARLTYALTLQLEDADGTLLSNKAVAVNKCVWHVLPDGTNTGTFSLEPNIVIPGMTLLDPGNLPAQIYLRYSLYVAPFMGRIFGGATGDENTNRIELTSDGWSVNTNKTGTLNFGPGILNFDFWCFPGDPDILSKANAKRYRVKIASEWKVDVTLHRHPSIQNNIDSITVTSSKPWVFELSKSSLEECDKSPKPVEDFTLDTLTIHGTFGSAGSGWLDEGSIVDIFSGTNTHFPITGKVSSGDVKGLSYPASVGGGDHTSYTYDRARVTVDGKVFEFPLSRYNTWVFDNYITPQELPGLAIGICISNSRSMGFIIYFFVGSSSNVEEWLEYSRNR